jgi:glucose dehydrogenase
MARFKGSFMSGSILSQVFRYTLLATLSVGSALSVLAQDITPAPAFTAEQLNAPQDAGWLTNGGSYKNQRFSPLDQINRDTVKDVKGVWRATLGSALDFRHNNQAQPITESIVSTAI